ncbi:MAG TPA: tetratricopeptide repeat protein [Terriglobia bacterium]|nr:tetratricopeptide repeat protein [Terriglobia bacterium]
MKTTLPNLRLASHWVNSMLSVRSSTLALTVALSLIAGAALCAGQSATDRNIQGLQVRAKIYPQDYRIYDGLGAAYIQKGRETADSSYYELARQALNKSLDLLSNDPGAASAKTHMAVVSMAEHQFEDAIRWAQEALALGSGDPAPWAILGDALTDLGRYDQATAAYAHLRDPADAEGASPGVAYEHDSRVAYLEFLKGDSQGAKRLMQAAISSALALHLPRENVAWSQYQLGEICFRSGDLECAERAYQAGLEVQPDSYRNLAGLGELRAAQRRNAEAIALLERALAIVPFPMYAAALYDLEIKADHPAEAKKQYDLIQFISRLNPINERLFYRELALFYADHGLKLDESVALARKEIEVRQDIYTWDILAWTLYKNNRAEEAAQAMQKALAPGTEDALLYFHAGMIEARCGHPELARTLLERALRLNPHFHPFYGDEARRTLALLAVPAGAAHRQTGAALTSVPTSTLASGTLKGRS